MSVNLVDKELAAETTLLESVEQGGPPAFRTWTAPQPTVVVGRSVLIEEEVDEGFCRARGIAIVRRQSGGRSVVVGPGTLQYAFALPYALAEGLSTISGSKRFCNRLLTEALGHATHLGYVIDEDTSGDLVVDGRKVAGLALRRRRVGLLLHGTILVTADLELIASSLRHPKQEPTYRAGRAHRTFIRNLGALDEHVLRQSILGRLASLAAAMPSADQL